MLLEAKDKSAISPVNGLYPAQIFIQILREEERTQNIFQDDGSSST